MTAPLYITDYKQLSDADLILECQKGEEEAWDALVARYERLVYTIPFRYGLTPTEVSDVFQSVWLSLLRNLRTTMDEGSRLCGPPSSDNGIAPTGKRQ